MWRRALIVSLAAAMTIATAGASAAAESVIPGAVDLDFDAGQGPVLSDGEGGKLFSDVAKLGDGFLIGGRFDSYQGFEAPGVVAIRYDGSADPSFRLDIDPQVIRIGNRNLEFINGVVAIEPVGDDYFLLGGQFADGDSVKLVDRFGRVDPDFSFEEASSGRNGFPDRGFNGQVWDIETVSPGVFLIGGQFSRFSRQPAKGIARVTLGRDRVMRLDRSFESLVGMKDRRYQKLTDPVVRAIEVRPDGNILAGGSFDKYAGQKVGSFVQISPSGELMSIFDGGARYGDKKGHVFSILHEPNKPALVGGEFTSFGTDERANGLAVLSGQRVRQESPRLLVPEERCSETASHVGGSGGVVFKIIPSSTGGFLIAGFFEGLLNPDGTQHRSSGVARLTADLVVDSTFMDSRGRPGGVFGSTERGETAPCPALSIGEVTDGRIVVGGAFNDAFDVETLRSVDAPRLTVLWNSKLEETTLLPRTPVFPEVKSTTGKDEVEISVAVRGQLNESRRETVTSRFVGLGVARSEGGQCEIYERVDLQERHYLDTVTFLFRPTSGSGTYLCATQFLTTNLRDEASDTAYLFIN